MIKQIDFSLINLEPEEYIYLNETDYIIKNYISCQKLINYLTDENIKKHPQLINSYKNILNQLKLFFDDISVKKDILIYCGVLSNMLWSGYLSSNEKFIYNDIDENPLDMEGFLGLDVICGEGCCRHISTFFNDFLNENDYASCYIKNNQYLKQDYITLGIKRNKRDGEFQKDIMGKYVNDNSILGNHACVIFPYKNSYLVYDPTNIQLYIMKNLEGKLIFGKGLIKIHPFSLMTSNSLSNNEMKKYIYELSKSKNIKNKDNLIDLLKEGKNLIDKYSDECHDLNKLIEDDINEIYEFKLKRNN